ncbi:hypothetical protein L195_g056643 [Trifolium pratense]|uniref:Uncharacterized protein n=2 Tax=Trifolium pratense TaxID=57577 RepID=A0A2K3KSM7_TRIPR|nr:hypothetical protein L195_g056643 [Trifolium pratense]CAJ2666820.1 unnamed protein product [Trifolium pratense]
MNYLAGESEKKTMANMTGEADSRVRLCYAAALRRTDAGARCFFSTEKKAVMNTIVTVVRVHCRSGAAARVAVDCRRR